MSERIDFLCRGILWLTVYSVMGWIYETILCSIKQRAFVNRGFLNGPVCPIYGFGAVLILWLLSGFADYPLSLFVQGMVLTCTLEYLTSYFMEKWFHARWWDYSGQKFQLNGRICLLGAVAFGLFSVVLVEFLHPWVRQYTDQIPSSLLPWLTLGILLLFALDLGVTVYSVLQLNQKLQEIHHILQKLHQSRRSRLEQAYTSLFKNPSSVPIYGSTGEETGEKPLENSAEALRKQLRELLSVHHSIHRRLIRAYPGFVSTKYQAALRQVKKSILKRKK